MTDVRSVFFAMKMRQSPAHERLPTAACSAKISLRCEKMPISRGCSLV